MAVLSGRRLPAVAALSLLSGAVVAGPVHGQFAVTDEVVEKPSKEGEGRKLDASGLTTSFAFLVRATRSIDQAEIGGGEVVVNAGKLPLIGADWESFREHEGGLLEFETAAAIKLRTEADIVLGDLEIPAGNAAPGFPGVYSLWLRLDDDGQWTLIVNHEPDVWGTMRDPARDLGETPLEHSLEAGETTSLTIGIEAPEDDAPGTVELSWGEHRWRVAVAAPG